ncbi:hypothetical protein ACOSQ2_022304 [Xanthoceras sorbifolium]
MADQRTLFRSCSWKEHFSQHYLRHILDPSQEIEGMVLILCCISNFHWVLCKIVQQQKKICMYDSLSRGKDPKQRIKDIEPLTRFLPAMLRCGGFFDHTNIDPWVDGINLSVVDHRLLPQQLPGVSCGAFVMKFMENIMRSKDHKWNFEGKDEKRIREEIARDIFINSESVD